MILTFSKGKTQYIYNEELEDILHEVGGKKTIRRASHVEPAEDGTWTVDLTPSGINEIVPGFKKRSKAIEYEIRRLEEWLGKSL